MTSNFKRFMFNGLLLTAVSLAMRAVGVSFNAYISNKIGTEAMGLFTLISTVYGFAVTLATSGINLATTRIVSGVLGEIGENGIKAVSEKTPLVRAVMKKSVLYCLFFSILATLLLWGGAEAIGEKILRDTRTIRSLKILSITLVPISLSSALSGYFTAVRRVYKNAITQITSQGIRIGASIFLLTTLFANDVESACVCIVMGALLSEIISFLLQTALYFLEKNGAGSINERDSKLLGKKLRSTALPMAFSAYVRSALITIEHILIPRGLEANGATKEYSLSAYGTVQSMVFPIVFFPSAILSSFASLLIPEVARANNNAKDKRVISIINSVFETALLYAIGTAGIMLFFSYELGNVIYPGTEAGKYIKMIAPLIPVMYLDTATDALLKGLGEQVYTMGVNIVDSGISVVLVILLLPRFGITGYIMTVYFTELINAALSVTRLLTISGIRPKIFKIVIKPLLCVVASAYTVKFLSDNLDLLFPSATFTLIFNVTLTVLVYFCLIALTKGIKIPKKSQKRLEIYQSV